MLGFSLPRNMSPPYPLIWGAPIFDGHQADLMISRRENELRLPVQPRETTWYSAGLPHLETETLLSNLSIDVQEIGTLTYRAGDAQRQTAAGSLRLFFVLEGDGTCTTQVAEFAVRSGSLLIAPDAVNLEFAAAAAGSDVPPDDCASTVHAIKQQQTKHGGVAKPLTLACISLTVTSAAERRLFEHLGNVLIDHSGNQQVWQTVELLLAEVARQHIGARAIIESLIKNLLLMTMREQMSSMPVDSPLRLLLSEPQIARVVNAMTADPGQRFSVEDLARLAMMSPQALSRRFEAIFAATPSEYLQQLRLTLAATLLRDTDLPVKTIAGKVGFASRSHFSRLFSKFSGCDPTAYRFECAAAQAAAV